MDRKVEMASKVGTNMSLTATEIQPNVTRKYLLSPLGSQKSSQLKKRKALCDQPIALVTLGIERLEAARYWRPSLKQYLEVKCFSM